MTGFRDNSYRVVGSKTSGVSSNLHSKYLVVDTFLKPGKMPEAEVVTIIIKDKTNQVLKTFEFSINEDSTSII
jgi:hypothetical protein